MLEFCSNHFYFLYNINFLIPGMCTCTLHRQFNYLELATDVLPTKPKESFLEYVFIDTYVNSMQQYLKGRNHEHTIRRIGQQTINKTLTISQLFQQFMNARLGKPDHRFPLKRGRFFSFILFTCTFFPVCDKIKHHYFCNFLVFAGVACVSVLCQWIIGTV
jgi:hypothetical protein